ncbi:MAG: hypothetical protein UY05_C0011G0009 [Candidatus Peregrinibacteria bacterium GW2011_GWA2_47_7]|nr:MAG: hypothetical protein UY05_C0011G0009 [Candidatus Peregrinibacteria bacterium GW2011_GWA2_47_7]
MIKEINEPEAGAVKEAFDEGEALRKHMLGADDLPSGAMLGMIVAYQKALAMATEDPVYAPLLAIAGREPGSLPATVQDPSVNTVAMTTADLAEGGPVEILATLKSRLAEVALIVERDELALDFLWETVQLICQTHVGRIPVSPAVVRLLKDALFNVGGILERAGKLDHARQCVAACGVLEGNQNDDTILRLAGLIKLIKLRDGEGEGPVIDVPVEALPPPVPEAE